MKRLMAIGSILLCHAAVFVAIYFGRVSNVPLCGSDFTLFVVPFVSAAAAYTAVFARLFKTQTFWRRCALVLMASAVAAMLSTAVGMTIAFNLWGT